MSCARDRYARRAGRIKFIEFAHGDRVRGRTNMIATTGAELPNVSLHVVAMI
jgi:hypothetical protein